MSIMICRRSIPLFASGITITALAAFPSMVHAQTPLSYVYMPLDSNGLSNVSIYGVSDNYAVGTATNDTDGFPKAIAWNLSTGTYTALPSDGPISYGTGAGNGYALGATVTAYGAYAAAKWDLATGASTVLGSNDLFISYANATSNGLAVGGGLGMQGDERAYTWDLTTGKQTPLSSPDARKSGAYGAGSGYAVGYSATANGPTQATMWNLTTGNMTRLSSAASWANTVGSGFVVGVNGSGNDTFATAWNITNTSETVFDNTGLTSSNARAAANGFAFGSASNTGRTGATAWNLATGQRTDLSGVLVPTGDSAISGGNDQGWLTGSVTGNGQQTGFVLRPFNAAQGDTLASGTTARVIGNVTQTTGTTVIDGNYLLVGGVGDTAYTLAGGTLQGTGSITGNLVNSGGTLTPGNSIGTFTVNGDYTQGTDGVLNIEISDLTSFDQLVVTGNAALNGTLNLSFASTFPGGIPASFDLLTTGGSLSGFFKTVNIVNGPSQTATDYSFVTSATGNGGTRLTLVVVPESGAGLLALLGIGGGVVGVAVRRRK